ncbi:MAG TPA: hypothetical protein VJB16_04170 [archaeon]|nr:hypothetical protein [archaeon]
MPQLIQQCPKCTSPVPIPFIDTSKRTTEARCGRCGARFPVKNPMTM